MPRWCYGPNRRRNGGISKSIGKTANPAREPDAGVHRYIIPLENNPWAISDWTDELLEQAKLHPDLGTAESVSQSGEPVPPQFLSEPKLQWELPERPIFISTVINLADFDLTAERYHLKVGVDTLAMLLRTDTGGYSSRPELVKLPHVWPEFVVGMVDDNGAEQSGRLTQLWNPEEDVELFDLGTGERLNAYSARRSPSKDYGLLVSSDLTVEPSGLSFEDIGDDTHLKRLYLLPANSSYPVRVILTDDQGEVGEFWNSDVDGLVHPKPDEPDWASRVVTEIHPLDERWLGVYRRIRISGLDRHSTLQYIRVGGMPMDFDLDGNNVYLSQEFDISRFISMTPPHSIKVRLGLQKANQRAVVERSCWANAKGVMRTSDDGWEVVDYLKRQVADMARERIYKLVLPGDGSGGAELALMEGPVLLRKPSWSRPVGLGRLAGYGAPLEIRAPYNPVEDPVVISSEVRNPGILVGARFEENGVLCLDFHHSLEPSRHHEIVFWNIGDPPMLRRAEGHVEHRDNRWYLPSTEVSSGYCCVAVAYEGAILGSWWPEEIAQINVTDKQSALAAANMLKWMRAPIVSSRWLGAVRAFAHQYPAQVLVAWLSDEGLPQGLTYGSVAEEQWGSAVREIFAGWDPDPESANDVIRALGGVASDERDSDALQLLLREAPLLMGRVTKAWLSSSGAHGSNATVNKTNVIGNVRFRIADVPDEIKSPYLMEQWENGELSCEPMAEPLSNREKTAREEERRQDLLSQAAEEMGVDTGYVNSVIQRVMVPLDYEDLEYTDQRNVETALNTRPFRELLGLRILASLALGA